MEITCPSCGARHNIQAGMLSVVCEYCNNIMKIERDEVVETGQKSFILPFPTVFDVGKYFYVIENKKSNDKLFGKNVEYISDKELYERKLKDYIAKLYVYGQIRYTNDGGFWDDWFVRILENKKDIDRNKNFVIKENEGLINIQYISKIQEDINHEIFSKSVGLSYNGYFIQEIGTASIEGFKGDFPFFVDNQDNSKYVDLVAQNTTAEYKIIGNNTLFLQGI
ncbi:hypothetical protein [Candidatus Vampirococcus lugosii]|uniref:DUF4178 domain-containing protein n=1 Tax=Candidatus Vampirococcus lugosii TaxID=2789015 RepID=A0ABS5QK18_9BACT|nr:hypothetical protein [Candidatus Vampirococcus lugosii]MBS8121607.1 hypothetical protein [Candidatus Vampirococcus lugosii]